MLLEFVVQGHSRFSTHGKYLSLGCVGYSVECLYSRDSFPRLLNLHILAHLGLVPLEGSGFSSSKFVIGRSLFVLVFHVGLFVFAFFRKSRFRLKCSKVTETRTQTCLLISYIIVNLKDE